MLLSIPITSTLLFKKYLTTSLPINPPAPVTVSYRRSTDPAFLGEPVRVLFVDKNQPVAFTVAAAIGLAVQYGIDLLLIAIMGRLFRTFEFSREG